MELLICVVCFVVTSVITTEILATRYFKIVDGYVDDVCGKTKQFVDETKTTICMHQQKYDQEE